MENLKIRKYLFFTHFDFDNKITKISQNDIRAQKFCKNLIETIKYMLY